MLTHHTQHAVHQVPIGHLRVPAAARSMSILSASFFRGIAFAGLLLALSIPARADLILDSCGAVTLLEQTGNSQVMSCTVKNTGDVDVQVQGVFAWVRPPGPVDPSDKVIEIVGVGEQDGAIISPDETATFQYRLFSDDTDPAGEKPDFGLNIVNIILDAVSCDLEVDIGDDPFCFGGFVKGRDRGGIAVVVDTAQVTVPPSLLTKRPPSRSIRSEDQYNSIVTKVGNRGFTSFNSVPEPASLGLTGGALILFALALKRSRRIAKPAEGRP
jgi:hypothetical protein